MPRSPTQVNLVYPLFNTENDLFTYLDHYLKQNQVTQGWSSN